MSVSKARRNCINHPDLFCYVCGLFTLKNLRRNVTEHFNKVYKAYFDSPLGNHKIKLGHHIQFVAPACAVSLTDTMVSVLLASHLEYQWYGMSKVIIPMTAISARAKLKAYKQKIERKEVTLAFHQH